MGFVKDDWLQRPETKYMGTEVINGVEADHWLLQTNWTSYDNHYYSTPEPAARPVRFMEHVTDKEGRVKSWDFDLSAFSPGDHFQQLLLPPAAGSCNSPCAVIATPGGYPGCTWRGE